ncbi:MAG: AsmA family protein [Methylococcales bacterium]|nr:AsmA family protein [Methylococcales bacterium]
MKKPLKVTLAVLSVLSVLLLITMVVFGLIINPNTFKPELSTLIKQRTGRELSIPGDITLSIFPALDVKIGAMALSNAANFPDKAFAEMTATELRVKWLPLLSNKIELSQISLRGLSLNLSKNKQGENNWDDLVNYQHALAKNAKAPLAGSTGDKANAATLSIDVLRVEQGSILWDNQQAERTIMVSDITLNADKVAFDQPVALAVNFNVNAGLVHKVDLNAQVRVDNALNDFKIDDLKLDTLSTGDGLPGGHLALTGLIKAIEYHHQQQSSKLTALQLNAHNLSISADFTGQQLRDNADIQGSLRVAEFNVKQFLQQQTAALPVTQDPDALSLFAADVAVHATDHSVTLNDFNVKLDKTTLKGSAELLDFKNPAITFVAEIDALDVDGYFAPQANVPTPMLSSAVILTATDQALQPLERLKNVQLNGNVLLRQLKMNHLELQDVTLAFQGKDGQLQTQQTIKQLYQGSYQGNASLMLQDNMPHISVDEKIAHMNLEKLLTALNAHAPLSGLVDVTAQLQGQGNTPQALKASLAGDIQFLIESGAVKGFNLQKLLNNAKSLVRGEAVPPEFKADQSVFSQLKGTAKVSQGVIENHDLVAASTNVAVNGEGSIDLNTAQIAYTLKAQILKAATPIKALKDWPLTLKISGDLSNPTYTIDSIGGLLEKNKVQIEEKKTELLEKLDKTLHKKLGIGASELLKKFF